MKLFFATVLAIQSKYSIVKVKFSVLVCVLAIAASKLVNDSVLFLWLLSSLLLYTYYVQFLYCFRKFVIYVVAVGVALVKSVLPPALIQIGVGSHLKFQVLK